MNAKNRVPWIVAAAAMMFAMIVLVRNEIVPGDNNGQQFANRQPVIQAMDNEWRPSNRPPAVTPPQGDYSPWTDAGRQPTPAPTPSPTVTPTPEITPTPRPMYEFKGLVTDDQGIPVPDALVRIVSGKEQAAERSAVAGPEGRFVIEGIPDNVIDKVVVEAQGYSPTGLQDVMLPLPELEIGLSPLAGIDAIILDFESGVRDPGLFNGEMQASLMELRPAGDESTNPLGISEPVLPVDTYVAVRDQRVVVVDGALRFDNVEPGRYRVAVKMGQKVAESESLVVADGSRTSTTLVLGMKHTVTGNVMADDTKSVISQARVSLSPAGIGGAGPEFPDYLSFTDGAGEFVIPEVQPGRYWMVVGAKGYTTRSLENFTVLPGAPPEHTSVTLSKQEPLVTVSVTNAEGHPMAQAPLVLMTTGAASPRNYFGRTDEAGLYRFENLMAGRYTLSVTAPGDRSLQKIVNIDLGDGEVQERLVQFTNPSVVTGKAVVDGEPYKGVLSFVLRGAVVADKLAETDEQGAFSIDLEPGDYMVGTPDKPGRTLVTIKQLDTQAITVELP